MKKAFKEAVRLESPGGVQVQVLRQPFVNQVDEAGTDRKWIHRNGERHPVDHLRVFREIELVPVVESEHPIYDELSGKINPDVSLFNRWNAEQRQRKALEGN